MKPTKRRKLERAGWTVGDTQAFLDIEDAEMSLIEMRVLLAMELRRRRLAHDISQSGLADLIGSSQSRVAKMEAGDPSVSIDLLMRSLLAIGLTRSEIGTIIARSKPRSSRGRAARAGRS